jgi:hypothetical protein
MEKSANNALNALSSPTASPPFHDRSMNIAKQFDELMANLRAHYPLQARQFEEKMSRLDIKAIEELRTLMGKMAIPGLPSASKF